MTITERITISLLMLSILSVGVLAVTLTHVSGHIDIDFGNSALAYQIPMKAVSK